MNSKLLFSVLVLSLFSCSHQLPDFSSTLSSRLPTKSQSFAHGEYSLGCLDGAVTFRGDEKGLLIAHKNRGRYWGHPSLIKFLTDAGSVFYKNKKNIILGDLSQSRGGPMLTGHNSHQNGLDVDIWFKMPNVEEAVHFQTLETEEMQSIKNLDDDQKNLIKYFASQDLVERIFINPSFKKKLCEDQGPLKLSFQEQRKMRAWWGHDDHIHVRIKCPSDSLHCVSQKPIPDGDGCGEDLNWWFSKEANLAYKESSFEEMKEIYHDKVNKLPSYCDFYKSLN